MGSSLTPAQINTLSAQSGKPVSVVNDLIAHQMSDIEKAAQLIALLLAAWMACEAARSTPVTQPSGGLG